MYKSKNNKGFTFIELNVVMLILAVLFAGASITFSKLRSTSYSNDTKSKMDKIEKALKVYFLENSRLPCPAGILLIESDVNFGVSGACMVEDAVNGVYLNGDIFYGAIPFKDLGISPELTYDAWGNNFSYFVNGFFVASEDSFAETSGKEENISILDTDGNTVKANVIVAVISHGVNGYGSFKDGVQRDTIDSETSTDYDENDNIFYQDISDATSFDNILIDDFAEADFDDILRYFDKESFAKDIEIERIGCMQDDITDYVYTAGGLERTITWSSKSGFSEYEDIVGSTDACYSDATNYFFSSSPSSSHNPARRCLKNGQWSDVMYGCIEGCGDTTALVSALNTITSNFDPYDTSHLDTDEPWLRVALGEDIVLKCTGNKTGYVKMSCTAGGSWAVPVDSGNCVDTSKELTTN